MNETTPSVFVCRKATSVVAATALLVSAASAGAVVMAPAASAQVDPPSTVIGSGTVGSADVGSAIIGSSVIGSSSIGSSASGSSAAGSVGSAALGSAAVGSVGSAALGSAPEDEKGAYEAAPGKNGAHDGKAPGTESGRTDVVAADSGSQLPVTGVDIGVAAGIAGALMVLGGLLIGRRATAN